MASHPIHPPGTAPGNIDDVQQCQPTSQIDPKVRHGMAIMIVMNTTELRHAVSPRVHIRLNLLRAILHGAF